MTYMDLLNRQPVRIDTRPVLRGSVGRREDARNLAAAIDRSDDDSASFREARALMHQRTGVCG